MNELKEIAAGEPGGLGLAVGSVVAGRYVLLAHLGGGRFGPVFEAVDRALSAGPERERRVVLHAIDASVADDLVAELARCRAAPQAWLHPNIVKVLDFGRGDRAGYVLTELLEGLTLRRVLDDIAPELLAPEESFAIVGKVGAALRYAHAKGVVHGDLRPETVFVTTSFGVKVLDFWPLGGAAAVRYAGAEGSPATPSDDVYALACLAYELLTARHPFNGNAPSEARRADLKPAPIVGLTHGRWQAISRGLLLDSAERTPTVAEFLAELGVTGHEELPRSSESQASQGSQGSQDASPAMKTPPPRYAAAAAARVAPVHAVADHEADIPTLRSPVRPRRARAASTRRRRRSSSWLFLLPAVLVAGLGVAVLRDYDEMRGAVTELITAGAERVDGVRGLASPTADGSSTAVAAETATPAAATRDTATAAQEASVVQDTDAAAVGPDTPDASARTSALDTAAGEPERQATEPARAPANASNRAGTRPVARTTAAALGRGPVGASASTGGAAVAGEQQIAAADVASAPGAPATAPGGFALVETSVSAAEGDGLARVTVRHAGLDEEPVRVFWWTGGHTAEADDDYADLEGVETLAPGASREILVPLADDVWPEDAESFFVYFGLELARRRTQTPAAQAEILVVDDDR